MPGSTTLFRFDDGLWVPTTSSNPMPALTSTAVCTWPRHGVLLTGSNQTWVFDGTTWTSMPGVAAPGQVRALAFDAARGVAVAVAAAPADVYGSRLWEFDGVAWLQRTLTSSPPTLTYMNMAWESASQVCLLRISNGPSSATGYFTWNGASWTTHSIGGSGLLGFGMATAPAPGGVLFSGGFTDPFFAGQSGLWRIGGGQSLQGPGAPPLQTSRVAWFDAGRGRTVVTSTHGNRGSWYWDGSAWSWATRGRQAPERTHAFAYDSWRGRLLSFGGAAVPGWELDETWQLQAGAPSFVGTGPSPRIRHALAFDSRRGRLVVSGGARSDMGGGHLLPIADAGVHEFDGATWTTILVPPSLGGPLNRVDPALAFDRTRGRIVQFGGAVFPPGSYSPVDTADTFEWDGSTWTQHQPATSPPASSLGRMVFDPQLGQCVLREPSGTVWSWDGVTWSPHPISPAPGRIEYDEAHGRWVAFGATQTWEHVNGAWTPIAFAGTNGPMAFDLAQGAFAGSDGLGDFTYGDPAAATLRSFGVGCGGSAGVPVLHGDDAPRLGRTLPLHLSRAPAGAPFTGMLGADAPTWLGLPLPIDLALVGMPGCTLHTAIDAHVLRVGTTSWPIVIPATAALLGNRYRAQAFVFDAPASPLGATTSNALELRLGN